MGSVHSNVAFELKKVDRPQNAMLRVGGWFSLAFAVFQLSGIWWPPHAVGYLGGPANLCATRPITYSALCVAVAIGAAIFGFYALSGAGDIRRLPLLRACLVGITAIYLLRGLLLLPQAIPPHHIPLRFLLFSAIALAVGVVHLIGTIGLFRRGIPQRIS